MATAFSQLDICVEPVLSLDEALVSPIAEQRGWVVDVPLSENLSKQKHNWHVQLNSLVHKLNMPLLVKVWVRESGRQYVRFITVLLRCCTDL
jgi:hypothetical protein